MIEEELSISAREIVKEKSLTKKILATNAMVLYMSKSTANNSRKVGTKIAENGITPGFPDEPSCSRNNRNDIYIE